MKGIIKKVPLCGPVKVGQQIIFPWLRETMIGKIDNVGYTKVGKNPHYIYYEGLEGTPYEGAGGGRPIHELQTLVIEYEDEESTRSLKSRILACGGMIIPPSVMKQLPIQESQWQEIIDKGLIGQEVEAIQLTSFPESGKTEYTAQIKFPSPKTYTEEECFLKVYAAYTLGWISAYPDPLIKPRDFEKEWWDKNK